MGLLGRMVGWDQQKEAHNAVLANHLVENASMELRKKIVQQLVFIQHNVTGRRVEDANLIIAELSQQTRIVQMNFIALACNSLGVSPALKGLYFESIQNPYRSDNESSLARIDTALDDLSRRSRRQLHWPGNSARIDFLEWAGYLTNAVSSASSQDQHDNGIDTRLAAHIAFNELLGAAVELSSIYPVASELATMIEPQSNQELALATSLVFFEQPELKEHLRSVQMTARLVMLDWLENGQVGPGAAGYFENQLYEFYKA